MINAERLSALLFWILMIALSFIFINRGKKGWFPELRSIPAVDALEESIGRAVELGSQVHFSPGMHNLRSSFAPWNMAGYSCLRYIMRLTARLEVPLVLNIIQPEGIPMVESMGKESYALEGKDYNTAPVTVNFYPDDRAYTMGTIGSLLRDKPASVILVGAFMYPLFIFGEIAQRIGAFSIGGDANINQMVYCVALFDHAFIGEEVMVAGAYLDEDRVRLSSVVAQDIVKLVFIGLCVFGSILISFGIPIIKTLLGG